MRYEGSITDTQDALRLGHAIVDYTLLVTVLPCGQVDLDCIEIVAVRPQDGSALHRPMTAAEADTVERWIDARTLEQWDAISREVLKSMEELYGVA